MTTPDFVPEDRALALQQTMLTPYKLDTGFFQPPSITPDITQPEEPGGGWIQGLGEVALTLGSVVASGGAGGLSNPAFQRSLWPALELDNPVVNAWQYLTQPAFVPEEGFDLEQALKDADLWDEHRWQFTTVQSSAELAFRAAKIRKEEANAQLLAAAGPQGVVARVMAGAIDPTMLLPFVGAGAKGWAAIRSGLMWGAIGGAVSELPLQLNQELRTLEDSALNVGFQTVIGAGLGGAVGYLNKSLKAVSDDMDPTMVGRAISPSEERVLTERRIGELNKEIKRAEENPEVPAQDWDELVRERDMHTRRLEELNINERNWAKAGEQDEAIKESAIGKKAAAGADVLAGVNTGARLADMVGIGEKLTKLAGPVTAVLGQELSAQARWMMAQVSTAGLRLEGNVVLDRAGNIIGGIPSNSGGTAEAIIGMRKADKHFIIQSGYNNYQDYMLGKGGSSLFREERAYAAPYLKGKAGGKLNRRQFFEAVGKAMLNGDVHEIPEVQLTAQQFRGYYDRLLKEAQELGIIPEEIKRLDPDLTYLNRVYDQVAIQSRPEEFMQLLEDHFKNVLQDQATRTIGGYVRRTARDTQLLADIDLPMDEAVRLRSGFEQELKALNDLENDDIGAAQSLVNDLRKSMRANSIERKQLERELKEPGLSSADRKAKQARANRLSLENETYKEGIQSINDSMGPDLEARQLRRRELKGRIRNLNRSRFMVEAKARAKYDKIQDLEDANIEQLNEVVRQGNRALKAIEKEDAQFDKEMEALRSAVQAAGDKSGKLRAELDALREKAAAATANREAEEGKSPATTIIIHGGADFENIDPSFFGSGEPGNIRPLGNGLYSFVVDPANPEEALRAIEAARVYSTKYGKGEKKLHIFAVPNTATASFNGPRSNVFPRAVTPEEEAWLTALQEADKIPAGPERRAAYAEADKLEAAAKANPSKPQLRGERLPSNLTELSVLDPTIAKRMSKFGLEASNEDILNQITKAVEKSNKPVMRAAQSEEEILARLFKKEERSATADARLDEANEELAGYENINWAERGRADTRGMVQDIMDAALRSANEKMAARTRRIDALTKGAEKLSDEEWLAKRQSIVQRMRERRVKTDERMRNLGVDYWDETGKVDLGTRPKEIAQVTREKIQGTNVRLPGFDAIQGERGAEIARTLSIDGNILASRGFLVTDAELLLNIYHNTLVPDIELTRKLGSFKAADARNIEFAKLNEEQTEVERTIRANMLARGAKEDEIEQAIYNVGKHYKQTRSNLNAVIQRLRNNWGLPSDPDAFSQRAYQLMMAAKSALFLGTVSVSSLPDIARPIIKYGMRRFMKQGFIPMFNNWKALKMTAKEANLGNVALESVTGQRALQLSELSDYARRKSKFEAGLEWGTSKVGLIGLFAPWTDLMKTLATASFNLKLNESIAGFISGKINKADLEWLNSLGLTDDLKRQIWDEFQNGGAGQIDGVWVPQTENWTNPEAVKAYRTAMYQESTTSIITPGVEIPKMANSSNVARLIFSLKSYALSATSKVLMSGLQQRDAALVQGLTISIALGALSYYLKAVSAGGQAEERMRNLSPEGWIDEALEASGTFGVFDILTQFAQDIPGVANHASIEGISNMIQGKTGPNGTSRSSAGGMMADIGGPVYSIIQNMVEVLSTGKPTRSTVHSLRQLTPLNNFFYLKRVFDAMENNVGDMFNLPGKSR